MISKAIIEDVPALYNLINSAYRGESSKKGWTTEANLLEGKRVMRVELAAIIQNKKNIILKFTDNNQIIGCVSLVEKTNQLYLGMLTVNPELQNRGIGKKLLYEAEVQASILGLPIIMMKVISIREELIAWYKRHGYIDTGRREPFLSNAMDIITSKKPLEFIVLEKRI